MLRESWAHAGKPAASVTPASSFSIKPLAMAAMMLPFITLGTAHAVEDYVPDIEQPDISKEFQERRKESDQSQAENGLNLEEDLSGDPHIEIRTFSFRNLPEYPEAGVTRAAIEELTETLRQKYMRESEKLGSGFTQAELEEIGALLQEKAASKSTANLNLQDLADLVNVVKRQNALRGMTYTDIESITQEVTQFYRSRGLLLAKAYIPPQEVSNGVVELDIIAGTLGAVTVAGNEKYSAERLQEPFAEQIGDLVDNGKIEESIYLLNDMPGLNVFGFFERGEKLGETNLNLQVRDEKAWNLSLRADNHGPEYTGEYRLYGQGNWLNPTGIGDQLTLGTLKSFNPENTQLYQISYSFPIAGPNTRLELFAEDNDFKITSDKDESINILGIEGANTTYSAALMHKVKRSRAQNLAVGMKLAERKVKRKAKINNLITEGDHARSIELIAEGDMLGTSIRTLNMGRLSLQYGKFRNDTPKDRGDDYYKVALDTNSLFFIPLPFESESRLILKSKLRYSESGLPSFEQMSLGGANSVRAFTVNDFSADTGAYLGAEMYFDVPEKLDFDIRDGQRVSDILQYAVFLDGAYGNENSYRQNPGDLKVADPWAHLAGAGFLMRLNWMDQVSSTITIARPLSHKSGSGIVGDDAKSWQTYVDLTLRLD
ncbi:ShlB/FhaC/HecB family hemolysin secretion/activation protein [Parendozoicomonas haliclonae]|uniref:Heme/hemopexin transporter protein HuxB n=1 Tax=Parendozoicomonas haliclonae TaxID=1960125 RepID=A0A1X7ARF8_9GAMM|nr:ShlB/FhaC/HecB family hemolysin secretion/activation protein [Parendozoicomonas haliclonae]SMA50670.1 Heme/hemopexin transporter protein HuxB precursor [Parendozoicomonas haliclonae]